MFYEYSQNNSGGSFKINKRLCHRVVIEADSISEADAKAEKLGIYFNGVADGMDCSCCGDRWASPYDAVDIEGYKKKGYPVNTYGNFGESMSNEEKKGKEEYFWNKYKKYKFVKEPVWGKIKNVSIEQFIGMIEINSIEDYFQFRANEHGWTTPDARIFYKNGKVKEIFKENLI